MQMSGISDTMIHFHINGRHYPRWQWTFHDTLIIARVHKQLTLISCTYFQLSDPGADVYKQSSILNEGRSARKIAVLEIP